MAFTWPFPPLNPRVVSQTATTVTVAWTAVPGCGYRFSIDGTVVSHTWDETMTQTRFRKPDSGQHSYELEPILIGPGEKVTA